MPALLTVFPVVLEISEVESSFSDICHILMYPLLSVWLVASPVVLLIDLLQGFYHAKMLCLIMEMCQYSDFQSPWYYHLSVRQLGSGILSSAEHAILDVGLTQSWSDITCGNFLVITSFHQLYHFR